MSNRPAGAVVNSGFHFWNNVVSNETTLAKSMISLRDEAGNNTSATLAFRSGYGGVNNNGWAAADQDHAMMECWFGIVGSEFIAISNLPPSFTSNGYTLRVYGDCNEVNRDMNYTVAGITKTIYDRDTFSGRFLYGSNYADFPNLTSPSLTIQGSASGKRSAVNAIEIWTGTQPTLPRIINFNATPGYVIEHGSVQLSWEVENGAQIWLEPGSHNVTPLTTNGMGTFISQISTSTVFRLAVSNAAGIAQRDLRVLCGPARPNLLFFLVDDMGWQDTSVAFWTNQTAFNTRYRTPGMESLAAGGMRFNAAYAFTVCSPSRISVLTGINSARHRVTQWLQGYNSDGSTTSPSLSSPLNWNINGLGNAGETATRTWWTDLTLPRYLRDQGGYRTIHIGKAHFGVSGLPGASPLNFGFDINIGGNHLGAPGSYYGTSSFGSGSSQVPNLDPFYGQNIFLTEALTLKAIDTINRSVKDRVPFFLYMSHYAVHQPIVEDSRFTSNYVAGISDATERKYATMVEGMDKSLRDLLTHLDQMGIAENTLVFFCSDNGGVSANGRGATPYGGANTQNWPLRSGKASAYEGGIRVPVLISWAKSNPSNAFQKAFPIAPASVCSKPIGIADFFPTMAHVSGLSPVPGLDGHDISGYLTNNAAFHRPGSLLFHYPHTWAQSGYLPSNGYAPHSSLRDGDFKVIYFYEDQRWELYDLQKDISESQNLAQIQPDTLVRLGRNLISALESHQALYPVHRTTQMAMRPIIPLPQGMDTDMDGIEDRVEDANSNGLVDPGETDPIRPDSDGDGVNDGDERRGGTNPLDTASGLSLRLIQDIPKSKLTLIWPSNTNSIYEIHSSINVNSSTWSVLTNGIQGTVGTTLYPMPKKIDSSFSAFFRVRLTGQSSH